MISVTHSPRFVIRGKSPPIDSDAKKHIVTPRDHCKGVVVTGRTLHDRSQLRELQWKTIKYNTQKTPLPRNYTQFDSTSSDYYSDHGSKYSTDRHKLPGFFPSQPKSSPRLNDQMRTNERTTLDFSREDSNVTEILAKFQSYDWRNSDHNKPSTAPDVSYRNTYGTKDQESPRLEVCKELPRLKTAPDEWHHRQKAATSMSRLSVSRQQLFERARILSKQVVETPLEVNSLTTGDQRKKLEGENGCLYSRLKQSIDKITPRKDYIPIVQTRPLKRERGRYRPVSRTVVKTPKTAARQTSPVLEDKEYKSAHAYAQYYHSKKTVEVTATHVHESPTVIIDPESKALQSVIEWNRPSPVKRYVDIPQWATEVAEATESIHDNDEGIELEQDDSFGDKSSAASKRTQNIHIEIPLGAEAGLTDAKV